MEQRPDSSSLFARRYRISSIRLPNRDYTQPGVYFVTMCTKYRAQWFGEIRDKRMVLSDIGFIVDDEWQKTATIRSYVQLDEYVIMPDHFHGIIRIHARDENTMMPDGMNSPNVETPRRGVSTSMATPNQFHYDEWKSGSLGSIMNHFKRACTVRIREVHPDFAWQPRYHERVIRAHDDSLKNIRAYIQTNPLRWK